MGGEAPGPARASSPRARAPAAVPRMGRRCQRRWAPPSWALASLTLQTRACPRSSKRQREGSPQTRSPQTGWRPQIRTARTLQGWAVPGWAGPAFRQATPLPGSPAQPSHDPRPTTHGLPQVTAQPWLELRRPRTREVHGRSHAGTARGLAPPGCKSQPGRGCEVVGSRPSPENRTLPARAGATGAPAGRPDGRRVDRGPRERRTLWLWHLKVPEL